MHFALNEDQIAVRDMAREFAAEKIAPHAIRCYTHKMGLNTFAVCRRD